MSRIGLAMKAGDRVSRAPSWRPGVRSLALFEGTRTHTLTPFACASDDLPTTKKKIVLTVSCLRAREKKMSGRAGRGVCASP